MSLLLPQSVQIWRGSVMCGAEVTKITFFVKFCYTQLYACTIEQFFKCSGTFQDKLGQILILTYKLYLPYRISG